MFFPENKGKLKFWLKIHSFFENESIEKIELKIWSKNLSNYKH
jgi:hypothetical protein